MANFQFKKREKVFNKYFCLITIAEYHKQFEELIADFQG